MIVDANLLLHAVNAQSGQHRRAADWLETVLRGNQRVGLPWQTIGAFLRISTNPRIATVPLRPEDALMHLQSWLETDLVWVPPASERTAVVLMDLVARYQLTGNLVTDAQLAALAIEHGMELFSADTDFARFNELHWRNPLA